MAGLLTVIAQAGPLPISAAGTRGPVPAVVLVAGSVSSTQQDSLVGISLSIDFVQVATARIFASTVGTHLAVVPVAIPHTFTEDRSFFQLDKLTDETTSDQDDFFTVSVLF